MQIILSVSALVYFFKSVSAFCPPPDVFSPYCTCYERNLLCSEWHGEMEPWDIKGYFAKVSELLPEHSVFESIRIYNTKLKEIPSGALHNLKFKNISINANEELEVIYPDAFEGSFETARILHIVANHHLANEGPLKPPYDLFNFVNNFKRLESLDISGNLITTFPENAFGYHPYLKELLAEQILLKSIGPKVFAGLPNLRQLVLEDADISTDEIDEQAFAGMSEDARVNLEMNSIQKLPQNLFKNLLDSVKVVFVGGEICRRGPVNKYECRNVEMDCDEESDWICRDVGKYKHVLEGFVCRRESGFTDIFDYCSNQIF